MPTLPFDHSCSREAITALPPVALRHFSIVATAYSRRTGQRLEVTSAHRTLRHTAALMADFTQEQLEGMYCRNGYPSYIRQLVQARATAGRMLTAEETYRILRERTEGYISSHLYGAALDVATDGLADRPLLIRLLEQHRFRTLDETSLGVRCVHATHTQVPTQIILE